MGAKTNTSNITNMWKFDKSQDIGNMILNTLHQRLWERIPTSLLVDVSSSGNVTTARLLSEIGRTVNR